MKNLILERDQENSKIITYIDYLYKKLESENKDTEIEYYSFSKEKIIKLSNMKEWEQVIKEAYLNKKINTNELLELKREDYKKLLELLLEIESTFITLTNEEFLKMNKNIEENLEKFSFKIDILKKYQYIRECYNQYMKEKYFNYKSKLENEKFEKELKEIKDLSIYYKAKSGKCEEKNTIINNKNIGKIIIGGTIFKGKDIAIKNNEVYIDGEKIVTKKEKEINIVFQNVGDNNYMSVEIQTGNIEVEGDLSGNINIQSGNIIVKGNINGNCNTVTGNITAGNINGRASSMTGDIIKK